MSTVSLSARTASQLRAALAVPLAAFLRLLLPLAGNAQHLPAKGGSKNEVRRPSAPTAVAVRFTDDRVAKFAASDSVRLATPYGKLVIPIAHIRSIDFATRVPEADAHRADAAVAGLGSAQYRIRRAAEAELLKLREKASPALHRALLSKDLVIRARAQRLLNRLSQVVPGDTLEVRPHDVVRTAEARIAGRIEGEVLKVFPLPAGKGPRKLLPLGELRSLAVGADPRALNAAPDPGNLQAFAGQVGKTFWFKVTGAASGTVWGTKVYTSDSALAVAAVHAGVLKVGQTGVVRVQIVAPPASYQGSTHNGVTSSPYGPWPAAYRVSR
jgi:hypothetical protein